MGLSKALVVEDVAMAEEVVATGAEAANMLFAIIVAKRATSSRTARRRTKHVESATKRVISGPCARRQVIVLVEAMVAKDRRGNCKEPCLTTSKATCAK